jgi:hypothetical protein
VSAWTEAESAQEEALSAREHVASLAEEVQQRWLELGQVVRQRDQPRSHAAEAVSWADVLVGQLAEATERPVEVSTRAGTLAECNIQLVICMRLYQRRNDNSFICMCVIYIYHSMRTSHENK